jgi:hypothetical protein
VDVIVPGIDGSTALTSAFGCVHAVWRIAPKTDKAARIELRYFPWGVAVGDEGIWVTVRSSSDQRRAAADEVASAASAVAV